MRSGPLPDGTDAVTRGLQGRTVHRLEIDLDPERLLGFRQQLLAQQLIGRRARRRLQNEASVTVVPVQKRARGPAAKETPWPPTSEVPPPPPHSLRTLRRRYCGHGFLTWCDSADRSAPARSPCSLSAPPWSTHGTFPRAQPRCVSERHCWGSRASASVRLQRATGEFFAEQALQPAQ